MKKIYLACLLFISSLALFAGPMGRGADAAYPEIEKVLKTIPISQGKIYLLSDVDVEKIVSQAADSQINTFELIDCVYRYLFKNKLRVEMKGSSLQKLMSSFRYGKERTKALMPIHLMDKIYMGYNFRPEQKAVQIFLTQKYQKYIEIGTALYEKEFGFLELKPHLFLKPYGMKVKKFNIKFKVKKIHLYDRGLGAIYVKGIYRPKKWHLYLVTRIEKKAE